MKLSTHLTKICGFGPDQYSPLDLLKLPVAELADILLADVSAVA